MQSKIDLNAVPAELRTFGYFREKLKALAPPGGLSPSRHVTSVTPINIPTVSRQLCGCYRRHAVDKRFEQLSKVNNE